MNQVRYDDEMRRGEAVTTPLSDDVVYFVTDLLPSKSRKGWDQRYQKRVRYSADWIKMYDVSRHHVYQFDLKRTAA